MLTAMLYALGILVWLAGIGVAGALIIATINPDNKRSRGQRIASGSLAAVLIWLCTSAMLYFAQ